MNWRAGIIAVVVGSAAGCWTPEPKSLNSDSAPTAIPAIKDAAIARDHKAIPRLIVDLDNGDSAIRFAAIGALEKMTGQTFGYHYYDTELARRPAIERWRHWLKEHPSP
jgi:hypothetical protein